MDIEKLYKKDSEKDLYPYVYMLKNEKVRELSDSEKRHFEETFQQGDVQVFMKSNFYDHDKMENKSGFMPRDLVPEGRRIWPSNTKG